MSELTDLEICKRIAEIEGLGVSICGEYILDVERDLVFKLLSPTITAKGFCLELVEKYEINLNAMGGGWFAEFAFLKGLTSESIQRAICLAAIKKSELE